MQCIEQPSQQVIFDGKGQVNYTEIPPQETQPITLTVSKTAPGENYEIEPARIESSAPWLAREQAVWSHANQIDADNGSLRLDLVENRLYVTQVEADGNAQFRRFHCERMTEESAPPSPSPSKGTGSD